MLVGQNVPGFIWKIATTAATPITKRTSETWAPVIPFSPPAAIRANRAVRPKQIDETNRRARGPNFERKPEARSGLLTIASDFLSGSPRAVLPSAHSADLLFFLLKAV